MKTHKIKGIGIRLGALTPVIAIIAIVLLTISIVLDTKELLAGPVLQVNQGLASIKDKVSDTAQTLTKVNNPIANIQTKLAKTAQKITRIPEEINLPALSIPDINLKIKPKVSLASRKVEDQIQSAKSSQYQDINTIASVEDISPFLLKQPDKSVSKRFPVIHLASLGDQIALGGFGDVIKKGKDVGKKAGSAVKDTVKKVKPPKIEWQNLQVKMPSVPATRVPVPGLKQAKQLLSKNLNLY